MSLEERFIKSHVLNAYDPFLLFDLNDSIHQQKGITVGEQSDDLLDIDRLRRIPIFQSYPPTL